MAGAKGKKRQSRLTFAPIADSPPSPSSRSAFTPSRLRYSNPFTGKITVKGQLQLEDYVRNWGNSTADGDKQGALSGNGQASSDVDVKPNLIASSKQTQSYPTSISFEEGSSDDEVIRPSKRRRIASDALNDNESHEGSRQSSPSLDKASRLHEDNTDVDSKMGRRFAKETPRRRSQRLIASSPTETKSRRNSRKMDLSHIGEPEESDAVELASPATHRKRRKSTRKEKSASVVELDDSDVVITGHTRKRQKSQNQISHDQTDDEEGSSDDDIVAFTPSRRSLKSPQKSGDKDDGQKTPKTPKRSSEQDELDLEEDLEDLRDTVVREKRTRGTAVNSARSNRQKHLEMLRRRRAGEKVETDISEEEEEEDSEPQQQQYHNTASLDWGAYLGAPDVSDSDAASIVEANEDLDADDSSFVEDDGELGVPADIPFEFSRHRTKHTRDCFRDVIEWMVHSKLNPAFRRNDDVYQFAFQKVSDEVVGRAGSQLTSSAWNADFVNTLRARPHLSVTGHPTDDGRSCDACNRSGHPASSALKFSGKPYSEETLEPLYESDSDSDSDDDSSDTSDEDSNKSDRDREGHILPPEQRHYYLGRTCKSNAVLTHTLIHWRFHLYEWVVDYLNAKEELLSNPQRSLDREKLSAKKRTKYANKVVDKMDADGEVQRLWMDFHQTIRTVREMKDVRQY